VDGRSPDGFGATCFACRTRKGRSLVDQKMLEKAGKWNAEIEEEAARLRAERRREAAPMAALAREIREGLAGRTSVQVDEEQAVVVDLLVDDLGYELGVDLPPIVSKEGCLVTDSEDCPPARNGCDCHCHTTPGVLHIMDCCPVKVEDEDDWNAVGHEACKICGCCLADGDVTCEVDHDRCLCERADVERPDPTKKSDYDDNSGFYWR